MYLQIYVDGFAGIGLRIGKVVTMETDGVGGELYHRALPREVGEDGGCADGNHGGEDMPVAEERDGGQTLAFQLKDTTLFTLHRGAGVLILTLAT